MAMIKTCKMPVLQEKSASGSVATFNTALAMPLSSCNIAVNAWQEGSGTPSPDNVRPINGYSAIGVSATGKNLLDTSSISGTFAGVTYTNANGIVTINGTKLGSTFAPFTNARVSMRAGISYTFSINLLSGTIRDANQNLRNLQCYLISTNDINMGSIIMYETETIKSITVTPEEDIVVYPRFAWWSDNTIVTDLQLQMQIERNNVPTDYQPFGSFTTITIGSTVYGGEYDARTGVFTATSVKEVLRGSYFSSYSASIQCAVGGKPGGWLPWLKQTGGSCEMFSHGLPTTRSDIGTVSNGCFIGDVTGGNQDVMFIKFTGYSSLEDIQALIEAQYNSNTPVEVVYKLDTPQTIQLPPCPIDTLEGVNNIWADTGNIDLTYKDLDIAKRGNFREVFKLPS